MEKMNSIDTNSIKSILKENIARVRARISAAAESVGRDPDEITLCAVTKYVGPEIMQLLVDLGVRDIGENKIQVAEPKIPRVSGDVHFHLIGHLQRQKYPKRKFLIRKDHGLLSNTF